MSAGDDRLEFVAEMTLLGFNKEKIAERLGVSVGTIEGDLQKIRIRWQENRRKSYTEFIEEQLATHDLLMQSLEHGIKSGSWKHIETALKIVERRAKTLGLDHADRVAQARVEIEARQLDLLTVAVEKMLDVLGLDDAKRELATSTFLLALEAPDILEEDDIL